MHAILCWHFVVVGISICWRESKLVCRIVVGISICWRESKSCVSWTVTETIHCFFTGASDPDCSTGNRNGEICCAKSCGACGGTGCSGRPGGSYACCVTFVPRTGRGCDKYPPPCVLPKSSNNAPLMLFSFHATTRAFTNRDSAKHICTNSHPLALAFKLPESEYPGLPSRSSCFNMCN